MAIQKELWSGAIQENFYKGIEVIKQAFTDDTMFLMSGANGAKTIHVPSAGSLGSPTKGKDRKRTRLNSSHSAKSRMPSSA